ncbi:MAG: T9SS type A sorting domain-containing protein [Melioribacteraceae bacterium]
MKTIIFHSFFFLTTIIFQTYFSQWNRQTNGLPNDWVLGLAIDACDSNCVVFSVNVDYPEPSRIYKTLDGAENWVNISPIKNWGESIIDISIFDKLHIWSVSDSGKIYVTNEGGETWQTQYFDSIKTKFFNYIEMFDKNNGIAMGDAPNWTSPVSVTNKALFLRTNDGGNNWIEMKNENLFYASADLWRHLDFINLDNGYFYENWVDGKNEGILKTNDSGNNWMVIYPDLGVQLLKFYNENIGLVRYVSNKLEGNQKYGMLRTLDGGDSWQNFVTDSTGWANDIEFIPNNPAQVWFTDHRNLFFSEDTGRTWTKQNIEIKGRDIVFVDENHGWILGDDSQLFYTDNNGGIITNVLKQIDKISNEIKLYQNYPNPFNPKTKITFSIPQSSKIKLIIYDVLGNEIKTIIDEQKQAGNYEEYFNPSNIPSGVYFYRLQTDNFIDVKKMIYLK